MHVFFALLIISLALVNGWTDAPSAIAGCVCTRSLSPRKAIVLAAVCNLAGAILMALISPGVAKATFGIANFGNDPRSATLSLCSAIITVVVWATSASIFGLPTSESHALISALSGAAFASNMSLSSIGKDEWISVAIGLILSTVPVLIFSSLLHNISLCVLKNKDRRKTMRFFKKVQFM